MKRIKRLFIKIRRITNKFLKDNELEIQNEELLKELEGKDNLIQYWKINYTNANNKLIKIKKEKR